MKAKARESGQIITDDKPNEKSKKDGGKYLEYIEKMVKCLESDGFTLPQVKKATPPTTKIQITAHTWLADALQGYWERNQKTYLHRAKSDYRALYLGAMMMFAEEKVLGVIIPDELISKLDMVITEQAHRHKINREIMLIRQEIRQCIEELDMGVISENELDETIKKILNLYSGKEKSRMATIIDSILEEEDKKIRGRDRQRKHRKYEMEVRGISVVTEI